MSRLECVRGVLGRVADELSDKELERVLKDLEQRAEERRAQGWFFDEARGAVEDAERLASDLELMGEIERRNAQLAAVAFHNARDKVSLFGGDDARGLEAVVLGSNKRVRGARASTDATIKARRRQFYQELVAGLSRAGVLDEMRVKLLGFGKGPLDDLIAKELWELRDGGTPGITKSEKAKAAAKVINDLQERMRLLKNRHGAWVRKMPGYIVMQSHDMGRIRSVSADQWIADVLPLIDIARTFGAEAKNALVALRGMYDQFSSGQFMREPMEPELLGLDLGANVGKKASQARVIHFNSAESWIAYNDKYGQRSLMDAVVNGLDRAARQVGLMETLGPNPRATWTRLLEHYQAKNIGNAKQSDKLRGKGSNVYLRHALDAVDGTLDTPASISLAHFGQAVRAFNVVTKLGGAVLSSLPDIATAAYAVRNKGGLNLAGAIGRQVLEFVSQRGSYAGKKRRAELLGAGVDAFIGSVLNRVTEFDTLPGKMHKLAQLSMKLNALDWWTNAHKSGMATILARDLYDARGKAFGELDDGLKVWLQKYAIGPAEWAIMAQHMPRDVDGYQFIDPTAARDLTDDQVAPLVDGALTTEAADRARDKLELAVHQYYQDRGSFGVLEGDARTKLLLTGGAASGSEVGELMRFLSQFKSYSVMFVTKGLGQATERDTFWGATAGLFKARPAEAVGLAQLFVALTALGAVSAVLKDASRGIETEVTSTAFIGRAMLQGGGLGLYGDYLLGEANRFGGGVLETVAGPTVGTAAHGLELGLQFREWAMGRRDVPDAELFRLFKANTPFANLFYTRVALDYLILYRIQEALSPGSLRRMEQRMKREQGREFLLPPSETVR